MLRKISGILLILFCASGLKAQYTNSDSLVVISGFEMPTSSNEYDSLRFVSPEAEIVPGQILLQSHVPSGKLLSEFCFPSHGKVISRFGPRNGRMHTGTDIKMNRGDTVYAAYYGAVSRAKYYYGYGNMVVIEHGNSLETSYAHLSGFLVAPGEMAAKGQPVGLAGSTGRASTSHLHFELREAGRPFDPELVFDFENCAVREEVRETHSLTELNKSLNNSGYSAREPAPQNYIVRSGDSLWKISRRFRTSVNALCQLNDLNENTVLQVGMKLRIN